jgi:hypothetical protein
MTIEALRALLGEAQAAHHQYEAIELGGVYDEAWPRWYASFLIDHDIGSLVGRAVTVDELARVLEQSAIDADIEPEVPDAWATSAARRIAADL